VHRLPGERAKNQDIDGALEEIDLLRHRGFQSHDEWKVRARA